MKTRGEDNHDPEDFKGQFDLYRVMKSLDIRNKKFLPYFQAEFFKIANSRNPFTRLYSAWNDKSRTHRRQDGSIIKEDGKSKKKIRYNDRHFHARYYGGWKVFETAAPPDGRNVTWEAFVEYIIANKGDWAMNTHWKTTTHQCFICTIDYDYI